MINGPRRNKTCLRGFANNKGPDQPAQTDQHLLKIFTPKIVSEYDQEITQSQTVDNPIAPRERAAQPSRDNRKTN